MSEQNISPRDGVVILARTFWAMNAKLIKLPLVMTVIRRTVLTIRLLRQGRFLAHLKQYIQYKRYVAKGQTDLFRYTNSYVNRMDSEGVLNLLKSEICPEPSQIRLKVSENPIVSIILPCYGKTDYTLRCLSSLSDAPPETPIEIIVIEDASGDPLCAKLRDVRGITYIENKENMGFLRSCNAAAKQAKGTYIFLLNNDTYVMRGAVDSLVRLLRERPDAGMTGARLLYPDGIQQEAGSIVWQDGSAWNYGRRDVVFKSEYCYVREVDYISGAAIMLSRALWNKLGGFDEYFLPAYCEDNDLAFRIRREGLKVLYQPDAWVVHYEGVSHGTDINTGIKSYQIQNTQKLKKRWNEVFSKEHFPSGTRIMRARDRAANRKITLVIDHYVPETDRDAGSRSIWSIMESFQRLGRIVKFWPDQCQKPVRYTEALQQRGIEVLYGGSMQAFAAWIKENGGDIDEVLISRPTVAPPYIPLIRQYTKAPIVFFGHDLHHARLKLEAKITQNLSIQIAAAAMKDKEIAVWKSVDYSVYPSLEEIRAINNIDPTIKVGFISLYSLPEAKPRTVAPKSDAGILFVAGFSHTPNVDAAMWFCRDILPIILSKKPNITVTLAGSNPTAEVKALASDRIKITGSVSELELENFYATARVAISPLRFGAGVKFKVVESMHKGLPLVTTPIGAQGLENVAGALEICSDEESFAESIIRFLDSDEAWLKRSAEQVAYVNRTFTATTQMQLLEDAFAKASINQKRSQVEKV